MDYPEDTPVVKDVPDVPLFRLANFPSIIIAYESLYDLLRSEMGIASAYRPVQLIS